MGIMENGAFVLKMESLSSMPLVKVVKNGMEEGIKFYKI